MHARRDRRAHRHRRDQKIYCGSGKKKSETWLKATINPEILQKHIQEYNGKKYVKININIGDTDKFGKDVQITIDTWQPTTEKTIPGNTPAEQKEVEKSFKDDQNSDLPF